jgi:hypothetical protein
MIIKSKKTSIFNVLALVFATLVSCTKESIGIGDEPLKVKPNEEVLNSFDMRYPDAKNIVWSVEKNFYVADFYSQSKSMLAWFTESGDWALTTKEHRLNQLNFKISDAFFNSRYAGWDIDKINLLERKDMGAIYVICVSDSIRYLNLYYSRYGDFVKAVSGTKNQKEAPVTIPLEVNQVIDSLFENPEIIDLWEGAFSKNVAVLEDTLYSFVALNSKHEWIGTYWNITEKEMPLAVLNASAQFIQSYPNGPCVTERYRLLETENGYSYLCYFTSSRDEKLHIAFYDKSGKIRTVISN